MDRDGWVDDELRGVPLPEGLRLRLRLVALDDDAGLDAAVSDVELPVGLRGRLRRSIIATDEGLDAWLRQVPHPHVALWRAKQLPERQRRLSRAPHWVAVAALLMVIGLSYVGAGLGLVAAMLPEAAEPGPTLLSRAEPAEERLPLQSLAMEAPSMPAPEALEPPQEVASSGEPLPSIGRLARGLSDWATAGRVNPPGIVPLSAEQREQFWRDVSIARWGVFGSHSLLDERPSWQEVERLPALGIAAPTSPAYQAVVLIRFGVHPFVMPAADTRLRTMTVPLAVDTDSYEVARAAIAEGHLPRPGDIRTEEFINGVDYGYPRPSKEALRLLLLGGPDPFWPGAHLIQAGVQAAELSQPERPPVHLVVALDSSASMRWKNRLRRVGEAIGRAVEQMQPDDRLSLLTFSESARVLVDRASPEDATVLRSVLAGLEPRGGTNLGLALSHAFTLANRVENGSYKAARSRSDDRAADERIDGPRRQPLVVLLTDGLTELPAETMLRLENRLSEAAVDGARLEVIDLRPDGEQPDLQLASLAAAGRGRLHGGRDRRQITRSLREIISGRSQRVASDARLRVRFHAGSVVAYRVLGHEPGVKTAPETSDMHAGQASTALWQVRLAQPGPGEPRPDQYEPIATATLEWQANGRSHQQQVVLRRGDLAPALYDAPPALRAAAVAAETAEVLRGSVFTRIRPRPGSLPMVLALAEQMTDLREDNPSFNDLVAMLRQALKARRVKVEQ